jgi:hypothetical protein
MYIMRQRRRSPGTKPAEGWGRSNVPTGLSENLGPGAVCGSWSADPGGYSAGFGPRRRKSSTILQLSIVEMGCGYATDWVLIIVLVWFYGGLEVMVKFHVVRPLSWYGGEA